MSLNLEKAKNAAYLYIHNKWNPLESKSYFNFFYVRVGEDLNHKPETVYADTLPNELSITNDKTAKEVFYKECPNNEYLLKVIVDKKEQKMEVKLISAPN